MALWLELGCEASPETIGLMLGEMRGRRAGDTRFEDVLLRLRLPPRPFGFLLVFVKGVLGVVADADAVEGLGAVMRGRSAGVARVLDDAIGAIRGVPWTEAGSDGTAAASGRCSSSMPTPRMSVDGLGA